MLNPESVDALNKAILVGDVDTAKRLAFETKIIDPDSVENIITVTKQRRARESRGLSRFRFS
jgi:hypothetical protein